MLITINDREHSYPDGKHVKRLDDGMWEYAVYRNAWIGNCSDDDAVFIYRFDDRPEMQDRMFSSLAEAITAIDEAPND